MRSGKENHTYIHTHIHTYMCVKIQKRSLLTTVGFLSLLSLCSSYKYAHCCRFPPANLSFLLIRGCEHTFCIHHHSPLSYTQVEHSFRLLHRKTHLSQSPPSTTHRFTPPLSNMSPAVRLLVVAVVLVCSLLAGNSDAQKQRQGAACEIMYRGRTLAYQNCAKLQNSGIQVFWNVWPKAKKIDTLIRAKHSGYIAFGWGYSQMIGATVQVVFLGKRWKPRNDNYPYIRRFKLNNKFSAAVLPAGPLRNAEYRDGFLAGRWVQPLGSLVKPGANNFAIWSKGDKPASNTQLMRHNDRGIVKLKV